MKSLVVVACLLAGGCGGSALTATVASSGTENEAFAISETARYAGRLRVKVHGELSDTVYPQPNGTIAGAWYDKGVVYWYRPHVVKVDPAWITLAAAHEVCHAKEYNHNAAHEACIQSIL